MTYGYDAASRLSSVSDGNSNSVAYSYLANSPLVGQIAFKHSGTTRLTTTKGYDDLNRLTNVLNAATVNLSSTYRYNAANQRTNQLREDGTYWVYQYDSLGQVISGVKYWGNGTPVAGQQFDYSFDTIGNRTQTQSGGNQTGSNLRTANYTNNLLNQVTSRDVPGYFEDQGAAYSNATVTANGVTAYQNANYYRVELPITNGSSPVYLAITNEGALTTNNSFVSGHALVAQTPENLGYDADGNLTNDGKWSYTWDAENRLIGMQSISTIPTAARRQMTYAYDDQGRRIYAQIMEWNTGTSSYQLLTQERYWYDGWNIIGRADLATELVQNFVWGLDLSGTMQGAGGVGGLLTLDDSQNASYYYDYDGNGNVLGLINANNGTVAAQYDYDPFLGVIRADGLMAKANPFLGSTKFYDWDTELYNYGCRVYKPSTGTWANKDPLQELGGFNLYVLVANDGINDFDTDGSRAGAGASALMGLPNPNGIPANPLNLLQMLLGLPFDVLSGDIFGNYEIPKVQKGKCNVLITVNGVFDNPNARLQLQLLVEKSPRYQGAQALMGVNPTTYAGDIIQILGDELGAIQTASIKLAEQINSVYDQFKQNGCCCGRIQIFAHSQGAMVFRRAWQLIKPEARSLCTVTTIGGQTTIQGNYGLAAPPENYGNSNDPIPVIGNYNPLQAILSYPFVGLPQWTPTTPASSGFGHNSSNYANTIMNLQPNAPCVPIK